jgi:hypothetical protein
MGGQVNGLTPGKGGGWRLAIEPHAQLYVRVDLVRPGQAQNAIVSFPVLRQIMFGECGLLLANITLFVS